MRDYARVSPKYWIGGSGRRMRGHPEAQFLGLYLITCPSSNMIGLYYITLPTICHETGIPLQGARKALARASEARFAFYDEAAELVWVPNAASYQIGESLKPNDNRISGVMRELEPFAKHRFAHEFFKKYETPFHLPKPSWLGSPLEGPSEPLGSQEQDQEQDQENDQDQENNNNQGRSEPDPVRLVFDEWVSIRTKRNPKLGNPKLDAKRRRAIRARLDEGFTVEQLKLACAGLFRSPFHLGKNDRGREFLDVTNAMKSAKHVEDFILLAPKPRASVLAEATTALRESPPRTPEEQEEIRRMSIEAEKAIEDLFAARTM